MTRTGFEPMLPPWKGGVLTTWPTGHNFKTESKGFEPLKQVITRLHDFQSCSFGQLGQLSIKINSGRRTRTVDSLINSQVLYQLSYAGITRGNFLSSQGAIP